MNRTAEFVLGLIGGIFGFIGAIMALFIGEVDAFFTGSSTITGLGWMAFLFSLLAVIGSVQVRTNAKRGGIMLIIAAIGGFISISTFYLVPGLLIIIAGIMGVYKKEEPAEQRTIAQ